jgi:predicted DNA-binding transcriptional regulator AlpA
MDSELVGSTETQSILDISRLTLYDWVKAGKVPKPMRLGGTTRIAMLVWFRKDIEEVANLRKAGILR